LANDFYHGVFSKTILAAEQRPAIAHGETVGKLVKTI
jgi:hypothetical protein